MSYASNLDKALKAIERNEQYIKQLEASGFKLPESYKRIPEELKAIKNDPNRSGISNDRLKSIQYLYNKNVINSRAKFDTTMTINRIGEKDILDKRQTIKPNQPKKLQEYSKKLNEMLTDYLDKIDPVKYPMSIPTIQAKKLKADAEAFGIDLDDIDFTKLAEIGPESLRHAALIRDIEQVFSNAPSHISPFKDDIYKQIGEENHAKFLSNMGFSQAEISLFNQYIDSSQFWNMIHKSHYSSSQETGKHEIRDVVKRLKAAMFDIESDRADFEQLQKLLKNGNNYRAVDNFVKKRLSKLYKQGKM